MRRKIRNLTLCLAAFSIAVAGVVVSGPVEPVQASTFSAETTEVSEPTAPEVSAPDPAIVADVGADSTASNGDPFGAQVVAPDTSARSAARAAPLNFDAGNIISDENFYNGSALTQAGVQAFLDGRKPSACLSTTVKCLESYTTTSFDRPANALCQSYEGVANERASSIIAKVGQACGISQKVLLVLLQKEQSLVGLRNPQPATYDAATGFGCPDGQACNPAEAGFFNQVYYAAFGFKNYGTANFANRYPVGATSNILFNSKAEKLELCGSAPVTVSNNATHALYVYTPYQPNAAALADLYGPGDGCSEYGNRNFYTMYLGWFGDPKSTHPLTTSRVAGADRFVTSVELSKSLYSGPVPVVYITTGAAFPDALSAAPAAAAQGGPLLLTYPGEIPASVWSELIRLQPAKIVVVGGDAAVSPGVVQRLRGIQTNVQVLAGADRFETSRLIAQYAFPGVRAAYLATGSSFPDALSAGSAAGSRRIPVVLVNSNVPTVDQATANLLTGMNDIAVVGGPAAVPTSLTNSLAPLSPNGIRRIAGDDRFLTSVAINNDAFPKASTAYLATGVSFPDALAGAAAAGATTSPLYVSHTDCVPSSVKSSIIAKGASNVVLLGGPVALSQNVANLVTC
jgi:putative cell wall-binding protein